MAQTERHTLKLENPARLLARVVRTLAASLAVALATLLFMPLALQAFAPVQTDAHKQGSAGQKAHPLVLEVAFAEQSISLTDLEAALDGREVSSPDESPERHLDTLIEEGLSSMELEDLKKAVEDITAERDAIVENQQYLEELIAQNAAHLAELDMRLPKEEALAERAVRERYKMQQHRGDIFEAALSSETLNDFIACVDYIVAASQVSVDAVVDLRAEREACVAEGEQLAQDKENVDKRLERANVLLEKVTAARDEAQRKADLVANAHLVADGANWDEGEEAFVEAWTPRIDAFLAGSPMQGLGEAFAKAAWNNHIDPRFSPAISTVESSNGRYCIKPHNAWGWGAADSDPYGLASSWPTWEDAVNAHVGGLARGYGYTVSVEGAKKYCPPNWEEWYATTVAEMNRI